jgi:hypothetical protein
MPENLKAGETVRLYCEGCMTEYEVTLEPKARGKPKEAKGIDPKRPVCCPFCGEDFVEEV